MLGDGALGEFALGEGPTEGQPFNTPFLPLAKAGQRQLSTPPGIGLNPNLQRNNFPNNQYDWPAPHRIRRSSVVLDGPFNPNLFKNPVPFFNHFESSFRVSHFIPPSNPYNQNLYTVIIVSVSIQSNRLGAAVPHPQRCGRSIDFTEPQRLHQSVSILQR